MVPSRTTASTPSDRQATMPGRTSRTKQPSEQANDPIELRRGSGLGGRIRGQKYITANPWRQLSLFHLDRSPVDARRPGRYTLPAATRVVPRGINHARTAG